MWNQLNVLMHGALFYDTLLMNLSGKKEKKNPAEKNAYVELVLAPLKIYFCSICAWYLFFSDRTQLAAFCVLLCLDFFF